MYETAVLFGGAGFIGTHLAGHLLDTRAVRQVVIADLVPPPPALAARSGVAAVHCDVRDRIAKQLCDRMPNLIVNLAAVHREPGHAAHEYFETNLRGAENVCNYAMETGCEQLVFTSSISVYGPTEEEKAEDALPVPVTPYGASKLVAEKVHVAWQQREPTRRRLLTVRPGVVFGPGERGNVTRLVRAVNRGRFVYVRNHEVRKAGGYVKELCRTITWGLDVLKASDSGQLLFNFSMNPTPTLQEFVETIADIVGRSAPSMSLPFSAVLAASHIVSAVAGVARIEQPVHPMRIHKLVRSNHICARVLSKLSYTPAFSLRSALLDWKECAPEEW